MKHLHPSTEEMPFNAQALNLCTSTNRTTLIRLLSSERLGDITGGLGELAFPNSPTDDLIVSGYLLGSILFIYMEPSARVLKGWCSSFTSFVQQRRSRKNACIWLI